MKLLSCLLSCTKDGHVFSAVQALTRLFLNRRLIAVQYFGTAIFRRYRSSVSCETMCELTSYVCRPSWWILSLCRVMPLPVWGVEALYFRSWWIIEMPVILTLSCIINQCSSSLTLHRARFLEEFDTLEFESMCSSSKGKTNMEKKGFIPSQRNDQWPFEIFAV